MDFAAPQSLHDLTFSQLATRLREDGLAAPHVRTLWRALQYDGELDLQRRDFPAPLKRWLENSLGERKPFFLDAPELVTEFRSDDGLTRKFLLRLRDGQEIETVLMGYGGRHTVCVSSQAGCAMGCVFCATGQMGFTRHLRPGEIVAQVLHARRVLRSIDPSKRVRNLVLMGMGEPLHNYDAVMTALETISDVGGISIGPSKIGISTVGVIPAIERLAAENRPYRLAVSLHGSTNEERAALVPVSERWSLTSLLDTCRAYGKTTGKRIFFEWTLIAGKNDSVETAERLASLLEGIDAHINLIPLNSTGGFDGTESPVSTADAFQKTLIDAGFPCTFRQRRGIDVAAGCGMLKAEKRKSAR
ncbi:MAG TPA: 23S rRNA (adenine(2503)-C(2))-methyltransferase RlmN [Verrucomicrobiales bacterium]|jgi:23S rRNA (adenine2503-C2)-methyltransferase|nr:23S rRNA (adenine(2503)-C(2))-methyltransferase RlmN [Verrucomicrobiales bacterium]